MPMNVAAKPEPGNRDEGRVEPGRERLREHRLARAGRAEEEEAALALSTGALERLPGLPDRDDAAHLLLGFHLTPDVGELDAPLGIPRLEGLDLGEVHHEQRPEEDQEVHDEEERQRHQQRQHLDEIGRVEQDVEDEVDEQSDDRCPDRDLQPEAPEPDPPACDHVLLAELPALEPEQACSRNELVEHEVERATCADDEPEGSEDRPVPRPPLRLVEPDDERRRRDQGDDGRGPRQAAPLTRELTRELGLLQTPHGLCLGRHW